MSTIRNPFLTGIYVNSKYFCDREAESAEVIRNITNGNNTVIISPQRMGKTSLIQHCLNTRPVAGSYRTFFLDIYASGCLNEFVFSFAKAIFDSLKQSGRKYVEAFFFVAGTLRSAYKMSPQTGEPIFDIGIGQINDPYLTLEEIFKYLESADKPCVIAINEFQQISNYPEKNTETTIRALIQKSKNCTFVFAGSQRNLMQNIFFSTSRPFYHTVNLINLNPLKREIYVDFVKSHFVNEGKDIADESITWVYDLFEGHTWYMQSVFKELFALAKSGETVSAELIYEAIDSKVDTYSPLFRNTLNQLSESQKELLYSIAKEGKASGITSGRYIKNHGLLSPSSVQTAAKQLIEKGIVTSENNVYYVADRFFGLWMSRVYGTKR